MGVDLIFSTWKVLSQEIRSEAVITSASLHPFHTVDTRFSALHISRENFLVFSGKTVYRKDPFALPLDTDMRKEQQKLKQAVGWQWAGCRVSIPVCLLKILA